MAQPDSLSLTRRVFQELERCQWALRVYEAGRRGKVYSVTTKTFVDGVIYGGAPHAAAMRATMDASKALAAWRKGAVSESHPK